MEIVAGINPRMQLRDVKDYARRVESLGFDTLHIPCLLYTSPSPRDLSTSRMPSSA